MKYILLILTIIFLVACGEVPLAQPEGVATLAVQEPVSPIKAATATAEITKPEISSIEDIQVNTIADIEKQFVEMSTTGRLPVYDNKMLTPDDLKVRFEKWSPDGQQMLLRVNTGKVLDGKKANDPPGVLRSIIPIFDLWLADANGKPISLLAESASWSAWSPDGIRIAYIYEFIEDGFIISELWVIQADEKNSRKLSSGAHNVAWLDNHTIVFIDSNTEQLQLININDNKIRPFIVDGLAPEYSQVILYDLSPDRQRLAFDSRADRKVRIADLTNGQAKLVTEIEVPDLSRLSWSPDSQRLAFSSLCSKPLQNPVCQRINIVQPDGMAITSINHRPDTNVTWSPNSRWVAFQESNRVYVADAQTGQFKVLYTFPEGQQNATESVDWSSVGDKIGLNQDSAGKATILSLQTTR